MCCDWSEQACTLLHMSALFRYDACSLCHWYELMQFTISRSVRSTHLWLVLLCTSLMFLKIPVCLYNSTMHLVHFFISLLMQHRNFWNFPSVFFSQRPKLSSLPLLYNIALYFHWSKNSELREAGGGVGWLYSHFKFHFLILPLNLQGARCVDHSWHGLVDG